MTQRLIKQPVAPEPTRSSSASSSIPAKVFSQGYGIVIRPKNGGTSVAVEDEASAAKKRTYVIIKTGLLIPGDGEPVKNAALVVEDKLIAWIGAQSEIPDEYTKVPHRLYSVPYVMPGLWDCHVHLGGVSPDEAGANYIPMATTHPVSSGARLSRGLWEALQRGYTSIRDLAGYGCEVAKAIDDGTIVGPNIYSSGACLSQTAGHGDIFPLPAGDVLLNFSVTTPHSGHFGTNMNCLVDGIDECRKAVRLQLRRGARVIKLMASGGVMSRDDDPLNAQFSPEELEVIVQEAARQKRVVSAHCHGKDGILAAVKAGVRTVEHVSFADQECIDLIKEKGVVYIATRTIVDLLLQTGGEGLPKENWEKAKLCGTNHLTAYKLAIDAGVTIALGTDTDAGFNMAMELEYAVKAGMTNLGAIKAATANGPLSVGPQAPKTGQLKVGYEADILGLTENPVEDVKVLQERDNIKFVWKGGKIYKGPGVGPWGEDPYIMG